MRTTPIRAVDEIILASPPAEVWPVIADVAGYVHWWPKSLRLRVVSGGTESIGTDVELRPPGGRPFRCRVEEADPPRRLRMRYHGGFLDGTGEWRLDPDGSGTRVRYTLDVCAAGRVVAILGRFLDLGRLHSKSMRAVLANLRDEVARRRTRDDPSPND
jgi:uncharacterized protein YndB with AHSA1/START domain